MPPIHHRINPTKKALRRVRVPLGKSEDYFAPRIASLAALATRNFTTRLAGIWMASPVVGIAADAGGAVLQDELAEAGQRESVLRILVSQLGQMIENFGRPAFW